MKKKYLKIALLGIIITVMLVINLFTSIEGSSEEGMNLSQLEAKAIVHPEAINRWCRDLPPLEGCCDHEWRECNNQNF